MRILRKVGTGLETVRNVLLDRSFTPKQIENIIPTLDPGYLKEPSCLAEIIDCWNTIMSQSLTKPGGQASFVAGNKRIPTVAAPPEKSHSDRTVTLDMNSILADIEPRLLRFDPEKLIRRHENIKGLGVIQNMSEHWLILSRSPLGFYLQEWTELTRKLMYIDHKILDLLNTKKELKEMQSHPIIRQCRVLEADYDLIRTRYLFASRVGYLELPHMYKIEISAVRPNMMDLVLSDDRTFMNKFAPHCSLEEYRSFAKLIKLREVDSDDSDIFNEMAELETIKYEAWPEKMGKGAIRDAIKERVKARMIRENGHE